MEARNYNYYYEDTLEETSLPRKRGNYKQKNNSKQAYNPKKSRDKHKLNNTRVKIQSSSTTKSNNLKKNLVIFLGLVNLSLVILTLYTYVTINSLNKEISKIQNDMLKLETIRDEYKIELSNSMSLEKVKEIAKYKLGMIYPDENQIYYISTNN